MCYCSHIHKTLLFIWKVIHGHLVCHLRYGTVFNVFLEDYSSGLHMRELRSFEHVLLVVIQFNIQNTSLYNITPPQSYVWLKIYEPATHFQSSLTSSLSVKWVSIWVLEKIYRISSGLKIISSIKKQKGTCLQ